MKSVKNHDFYQAETFAHSLWNLMISRYTKVVHIYPATVSKRIIMKIIKLSMIIINYYLSYYVLWLSYPKQTLSAGYLPEV